MAAIADPASDVQPQILAWSRARHPLLTLRETASALRIDVAAVLRLITRGELQAVRIRDAGDGVMRVAVDEIRRYREAAIHHHLIEEGTPVMIATAGKPTHPTTMIEQRIAEARARVRRDRRKLDQLPPNGDPERRRLLERSLSLNRADVDRLTRNLRAQPEPTHSTQPATPARTAEPQPRSTPARAASIDLIRELEITPSANVRLRRWSQNSWTDSAEAGGWLRGRILFDHVEIADIEYAGHNATQHGVALLDPVDDPRRGLVIGDWHSHVGGSVTPSDHDRSAWMRLAELDPRGRWVGALSTPSGTGWWIASRTEVQPLTIRPT